MATVSAELKLWVYTGNFGSRAATPNYTITKTKLSTENKIIFEVGELIKDYIEIYFDGDYQTIRQTAWVEWEITKTLSDASTQTITGNGIALNGYGYFEDGINPELSKGLLQSNTIMYVKSGDNPYIPIYTDGGGTFEVKYYNGATLIATQVFGNSVIALSVDTDTIKADHEGVYDASMTEIRNQSNQNTTSTAVASGSPDRVVITDVNGNETTVNIKYIEECKETPYRISFLNKFGVVQPIYFFKRRDEYVDVTNESYYINTINRTGATLNYSLNNPSKNVFNVEAGKRIKLNTGFVDQQFNEVIQQLIMTEQAWIEEGGVAYPITPITKSLQYKTQLNDKLINFTVEFEYAYSEINLIR